MLVTLTVLKIKLVSKNIGIDGSPQTGLVFSTQQMKGLFNFPFINPVFLIQFSADHFYQPDNVDVVFEYP